jgi:hypothetical protein
MGRGPAVHSLERLFPTGCCLNVIVLNFEQGFGVAKNARFIVDE